MISSSERTRWLLALQGFMDVPDNQLRPFDIGLRTAPLVCAAWTAVATTLQSQELMLVLSAIAALGVIFRTNVFDIIYNHGIRYRIGGDVLPPYGSPRRFACGVASGWLLATVALLSSGHALAGQVMGWVMVAIAGVPVVTGLCVPSLIFRLVTGTLPPRPVTAQT